VGVLGLRIDACTFEGLRRGVLPLLGALGKRDVRASLFSAMGPDRSGLAVMRVFRKRGFLSKMLRTGAARMYGLRTLLHGTLLPAPSMAERLGDVLRRAAGEGHEVGVHAWDHVRWQDRIDALSSEVVRADYARAVEACEMWTGKPPEATAAPAWITNERALREAERFGFHYASDTRGREAFRPLIDGAASSLLQVPVTLPTLDEVLGRNGATARAFHERVLRELDPGRLNVLCAHAESEGRAYLKDFEDFLDRLRAEGWRIVPLREIARGLSGGLPACGIARASIDGRAGEVSVQCMRGLPAAARIG